MFYDTSRFALTAVLENNWRRILEEYEAIRQASVDWRGRRLYDEGWKVFTLYEFPNGEPLPENIARCPFTDALVREHIPTHGVISFSIMQPHTRVRPHQDLPDKYIRSHLALKVPKGDCAIKVNGVVRRWEPGRVLMIDNSTWHEVWNLTDEERVLLLFDFVPEPGSVVPEPGWEFSETARPA
jgi:beta-hydroxylase